MKAGMFVKTKENESGLLFRRSGKGRVLFGIVFIILFVYSLSLIFPFFWLLLNSLKTGAEYSFHEASGKPFAFPAAFQFSNFIKAFDELSYNEITFFGMIFNSLWYTAVVVFEGVFLSAVTGYCIAKYKFKLRGALYGIAIFSMTIPIVGNLASSYKIYSFLGILDTPLQPIITCAGGFGFNFLIMYGFFSNISWSYAEAAMIDGAGDFKAFFKIMLPQARAPMLVLAVLASISCWNDYTSIILFMPSYMTLSAGLYYVESEMRRGFMPIYYSALIISIVPVLVLYGLFSDKIMKNMTLGGLKG